MFRNVALAGCVAAVLGSFPAHAQNGRIDLEAADCSNFNTTFSDLEMAEATQRVSIPVTAGALDIRPNANGGVHIERGPGGVYNVTACVRGAARTRAEAQRLADSVRLEVEGSRIRVTGGTPDEDGRTNWSVQLVVNAPDGASITAATTNGPIGASGFTGILDVSTSNGPISLRDVSGEVKAHANNGPISVRGSSGEFDLQTSNGPIDVNLGGRRWDGHLTARAANGPLSVSVPEGYQSGVEISSSHSSPWSCHASACQDGSRDWNNLTRSLRLGTDPIVVRLSTVNGPVTVDAR
jgi:hypothetical protein